MDLEKEKQETFQKLKQITDSIDRYSLKNMPSPDRPGFSVEEPVAPYGSFAISISDYYIPIIASEGVEPETAEVIARNLNLSQRQISEILHMSDRSYRNHIKQGQPFTGMEAEMIVNLLNMLQEGIQTFNHPGNFRTWLGLELEALNYKKPMDFLNTISGTKYITEFLKSIQASAFA